MHKIVLQDNDKEVLEVLIVALEQAAYNVYSTSACDDILDHIKQFRPHIVMLDFKLTGKECITTYKLIRDKYPDLPVIALSCNSNIHEVYSEYGFDDYIKKPFDLADLYSILRKHLPEKIAPNSIIT